jgi:hypothetical protein
LNCAFLPHVVAIIAAAGNRLVQRQRLAVCGGGESLVGRVERVGSLRQRQPLHLQPRHRRLVREFHGDAEGA